MTARAHPSRADRVAAARVQIHSRHKHEREGARATLLELVHLPFTVGEHAHDWLLGEVAVDAVWPTNAGARGNEYVVHHAADPWPWATYIANNLEPVAEDAVA